MSGSLPWYTVLEHLDWIPFYALVPVMYVSLKNLSLICSRLLHTDKDPTTFQIGLIDLGLCAPLEASQLCSIPLLWHTENP